MKIQTSSIEQTARLINELKVGRPVIIQDNELASLTFAVETLNVELIAKIAANKNEKKHLAITARRAETLSAIPYDGDIARIILPSRFSFEWLSATANPTLDLEHPLKGPFETMREGRIDISRASLELCKKAQLLPASIVLPLTKATFSLLKNQQFLWQKSSEILDFIKNETPLFKVSSAQVPLKSLGVSRLHVFRDDTGMSEHYAIESGSPTHSDPVLVRLHSACFTGDLIGSLKCDCGSQLQASIEKISDFGSGILIYLNQEGRGIGLANKMRAYELQNQGFDTVEANHRLGFEDEERDLRIGAQIVKQLGYSKVRLLTNNPQKIKCVSEMGITVTERIDLITKPTTENLNYLKTKAAKSGHLF